MHINNFLGYIDPGTGSMLFTIIIGVATAAVFGVRGLLIKLKYRATGKKVHDIGDKVPVVIFSDSKRYWNVFKPVCDELDGRGIRCEYWTMSPDDPALDAGYKNIKCIYIGSGNQAFARLNIMNATLCLATTPGLDVLQWKRSKKVDYYLHIYHDVSDGTTYRMFGVDHYDGILMSGEIQEEPIRTLEKLRNLPAKELVLCGSTYMDGLREKKQAAEGARDAFAGSRADDMQNGCTPKDEPRREHQADAATDVTGEEQQANAATETTENERRETTVLCAPSWGESSILARYGSEFIRALTETGYKVIVRPHPQSVTSEAEMLDKLKNEFPQVEWNFDNDNFNVLSRSDILISDFSGVVFDFAFIFDRPVIIADTDFDGAPYDVAWLDRRPWTIDVVSDFGGKLDRNDFANMKEVIDSVLSGSSFAAGREAAKAAAWANGGCAAQVAADFIEKKLACLNEAER